MCTMNDFVAWLTRELNERGWSNSELARRSELVPSTISMVISGRAKPGWEFCLGVARALGFPPEMVLRRAGLLPALPAPVEGEQEVLGILRTLTAAQRRIILTMLRALAPRAGYSLATDIPAPRPAIAEHYTASQLESELLENFRALDDRRREFIMAEVAAVARSNEFRIIGDEEVDETAQAGPAA